MFRPARGWGSFDWIGNGKSASRRRTSGAPSTAHGPIHGGAPVYAAQSDSGAILPSGLCSSRLRATFRGAVGCLGPFPGFRRHLRARSRGPSLARHLADSRIPGQDQLAGAERGLLEIWRIDGKDLPARYLLREYLNGSHVRELAAQTVVMLFGGREPHPVVCRLVALVAQYENNLLLNVDREASEHGARFRRQRSDRVEHELMRYGFAPPDGEGGVVWWQTGSNPTGF